MVDPQYEIYIYFLLVVGFPMMNNNKKKIQENHTPFRVYVSQ